jgi:hypothetical protein
MDRIQVDRFDEPDSFIQDLSAPDATGAGDSTTLPALRLSSGELDRIEKPEAFLRGYEPIVEGMWGEIRTHLAGFVFLALILAGTLLSIATNMLHDRDLLDRWEHLCLITAARVLTAAGTLSLVVGAALSSLANVIKNFRWFWTQVFRLKR